MLINCEGEPTIRKMEKQDVELIVKVHLESFAGFFLSCLGPRFLSLFYSGAYSAPEGIVLVYQTSEKVLAGFVAGAVNPQGFYSRLLKRSWLKFSFASIGAICRKPSIIKRVARALYHPSKNPAGNGVAGLLSIAVLPELQGISVGKKLVQSFLDEAKNVGCKKVFLTTDRDENGKVNTFYQSLGFRIEREFVTPEGRSMNEYWIDLP